MIARAPRAPRVRLAVARTLAALAVCVFVVPIVAAVAVFGWTYGGPAWGVAGGLGALAYLAWLASR